MRLLTTLREDVVNNDERHPDIDLNPNLFSVFGDQIYHFQAYNVIECQCCSI